jgi:tRNA 2-thiouridine synthesizing protein E
MEEINAGKLPSINEEGFLTDFSQWNKRVAEDIARGGDITLTKKHWEVISYLQDQYEKEVLMSIDIIRDSGIVDIKEFYQLFLKEPLITASKIAGIPKPISTI